MALPSGITPRMPTIIQAPSVPPPPPENAPGPESGNYTPAASGSDLEVTPAAIRSNGLFS
jgi:hypothetical protein